MLNKNKTQINSNLKSLLLLKLPKTNVKLQHGSKSCNLFSNVFPVVEKRSENDLNLKKLLQRELINAVLYRDVIYVSNSIDLFTNGKIMDRSKDRASIKWADVKSTSSLDLFQLLHLSSSYHLGCKDYLDVLSVEYVSSLKFDSIIDEFT